MDFRSTNKPHSSSLWSLCLIPTRHFMFYLIRILTYQEWSLVDTTKSNKMCVIDGRYTVVCVCAQSLCCVSCELLNVLNVFFKIDTVTPIHYSLIISMHIFCTRNNLFIGSSISYQFCNIKFQTVLGFDAKLAHFHSLLLSPLP